ncbi:HD domain-containing phosphohydrolase [candidate division CSSED10-310 bacterium]|uniref:HD domain-containing phosphohydrolase n=1 Tax=candidate division CSSED10-310 bacterium TaxID=2855610 RepID=A0ABV6YXH2_UNCC1
MKSWTKDWKRRESILIQILFFMIIAAVVPLLVSNWIFISSSEEIVKNHVYELNITQAENTAQWIYNYNHAIKNELESLCFIQTRHDLSAEQRSTLSDLIVSQDNNIDVVWIKSKPSQVYHNSRRSISKHLKEFVHNEHYYEQILAGQIIITEPFTVPEEGSDPAQTAVDGILETRVLDEALLIKETLILYGLPLWDKGQPIGAIYSEVNLTPLRKYIANLPIQIVRPGSELFIVERNGHIIAHQNEELAINMRDYSHHEVVQKFFETRQILQKDQQSIIQTQTVLNPDGKEMLANIKLVDELDWGRDTGESSYLGWGIVAQEPKEYAFFPIRQVSFKMKKYGTIAIILAIALAGLLAIRLSRPISLLTTGAERIAAGDYDVEVNVKTRNEIGLLAASFNNMTSKIRSYMAELKQKALEIRELFFSSLETIVAAIDARDPYTRGHSLRVTSISLEIGLELDLDEDDMEKLRIAAMLHDVGKIGIRDNVLLKKGKLTTEEFAVMKTHPVLGATIMGPIKKLDVIIPGMKYHHEWWDGSGYPEGKKGEDIPLYARIIAIADTFDAMTSDRPYQKRMDPDFVVDKIKGWSSTRYDPRVVRAFLRVVQKNAIPTVEPGTSEIEKVLTNPKP